MFGVIILGLILTILINRMLDDDVLLGIFEDIFGEGGKRT